MPTLCLRCTRSFVSVAWRSSSVAFLLVPLSPPPSFPFLLFYFIYLFIFSWGLFILLSLGFWPQCDGCYSGGLGARGLVAGLRVVGLWVFFRLGVYCGCSPLAHGHPPSTCDAGVKPFIHIIHDD